MKRLIYVTTVAQSMAFFKGQLKYLSDYYDITFVSSNEDNPWELQERAESYGVPYYELPMAREISLGTDIKSLYLFLRYFKKVKPDAVHGNTPKGALLSMVAAKLTGVNTRIYMCHGLRYQGCTGLKRKILIAMEKITTKCATHILCVSEGVRDTLNADGICSKKKTCVIGCGSCNGIDISQFNPEIYSDEQKLELRTKYGITSDEFVFISMGRVVKDKGVNEMIRAFVRYRKDNPKVRLMMLGVNCHKGVQSLDSFFVEVFLVDSTPHPFYPLFQSLSTWSKRELLAFELLNHLNEGLCPSNDQSVLVY